MSVKRFKWLLDQQGFTMIEMMIVLLIISILLLIAVPNCSIPKTNDYFELKVMHFAHLEEVSF